MAEEDCELIEYALGILDAESSQQLTRKLDSDPQLQAELNEIQDTLLNVVDADSPVTPPAHLRNRIMQSIRSENPFTGFVDRLANMYQLGVTQVQQILSDIDNIGHQPWEAIGTTGVQLLHFDGGEKFATADCGLVYLAPDTTFPNHQHNGDEWSLVLQGEVDDNGEKIYYPGDLIHLEPGSTHYFRALGDKPLILAVLLFDGFEFVE